jgi:hypothetical protein
MTRGVWVGLAAAAPAFFLLAFLGDRIARTTPARPVRYAAAVTGPALLALLFALTTTAQDEEGPWLALAISIAAAAQRRR